MHDVHLRPGFDLNLLRVLHALLTERSVSRAAKRLGLSQSATSHALSRLREGLGDPLVVRDRTGVAPTARAEALREPIGAALALIEGALFSASSFVPATCARRFVIAATDYAELLVIPSLLSVLAKEAPNVDVWIHPYPVDPRDALRRGDVDLVVGILGRDDATSGLHATGLLDDRFVCMVRTGHPLSRKRLTLARYAAADHVLIAPRGIPGGPIDVALAAKGYERRVAVVVPHFLVAPHVIAKTDLVVTVAERIAKVFVRLLPLRILDVPFEAPRLRLSTIWHDRHDSDPAHRWLRELLATTARAA